MPGLTVCSIMFLTPTTKSFFAVALSAVAFAFAAGCSIPSSSDSADEASSVDEETGVQQQGKIIGTNDLVPVKMGGGNIPPKYTPLIDAFGIITMGCTATHIGNGLVLTAGHCFNAPATRKDNTTCAGINVQWGVRADSPAYLTSACQIVLTKETNRNRDYAIFKVDPIPPVEIPVDFGARPNSGTTLTILGHPRRRPLEWSQLCSLEPAASGGWGLDHFSHQCDTEPGSSGSTILDDTTLKVVGIHDGGNTRWNYGTYLFNTPIAEFTPGQSGNPPMPMPPDEVVNPNAR
jgi:hypothetical protein